MSIINGIISFFKNNNVFGFDNYSFLLFLIPFFYIIFFLYKKKGVNSRIIKTHKKEFFNFKFLFYKILLFVILIFSLFIISGFHLKNIEKERENNGIDINIVLDISFSMDAKDIKPSRIEIAKKYINNFISGLTNDRVGLIVFAGKPFIYSPLTFDYETLKYQITNISTKTINQDISHLRGTGMGDALLFTKTNFEKNNSTGKYKDNKKQRKRVIILITDGVNNVGNNPLFVAKKLNNENIKIYTIGIGGDKNTDVKINLGNVTIRQNVESIDKDVLKEIANIGKGKYYLGNTSYRIKEIFKDIEKIEKTKIKYKEKISKQYLNKEFKTVILFLFLIIIFIDITNSISFLKIKDKDKSNLNFKIKKKI